MPPYREVDMPPYLDVDMPPYWEVDRPPPCEVLKLRGQTLKFGISGRGIISPPNGDAVLSDCVPEWDNN